MEMYRAHIVHMTLQGEHALFYLVIPDLDEVIVTTRNKHWLSLMEVNASDRP